VITTGRAKLIRKVDALMAPEHCAEPLVLMEAPRGWRLVKILTVMIATTGLVRVSVAWLGMPSGLMDVSSTTIGVVVAMMLQRNMILARVADDVVVISAGWLMGSPEVSRRGPAPLAVSFNRGWLNYRVTLDGHKYVLARSAKKKFETLNR